MKQQPGLWLLLIVALIFVTPVSARETSWQEGHLAAWTYSGEQGPEHWGALHSDYSKCSQGKVQSPLNIQRVQPARLAPLSFHYRSNQVSMKHTGHTVDVDYKSGSFLSIGGQRYELKGLHFHAMGEHLIEGWRGDAELHLVHENKAGETLVVAVLLQAGTRVNHILERLVKNLPKTAGETFKHSRLGINATFLLPANRRYYSYTGSLTTPPCTEGISWVVFAYPLEVPSQYIDQLRVVLGGNARPIQAVNDRHILKSP